LDIPNTRVSACQAAKRRIFAGRKASLAKRDVNHASPKIASMILNPYGFIGEEYLHGRNFAIDSVGPLVRRHGAKGHSNCSGEVMYIGPMRTVHITAPRLSRAMRVRQAWRYVLPFGPILSYYAIWQE
jgi:hypothetical protein